MTHGLHLRRLLQAALTAVALCAFLPARAQISLASAVDLAIRNSPRVKSSEADVARAQAVLSQAKDVYIPTLSAGAGIGQAYGYSNYPPTLFTLNSSSLIYNAAQFSYIHSARAGVDAAQRSLEDVREVVAEDAALTFVALDRDQQREQVLNQEAGYAARLVSIVQDRIAAGQDTNMDLINAKLTAANLHLSLLRTQQDVANDRSHLARLIGVPAGALRADGGFPSEPIAPAGSSSIGGYANASVAAAFASAHAKQLGASGDAHFLYRPQLSLLTQFNRYATFTNAWNIIENEQNNQHLSANEYVFGVQISNLFGTWYNGLTPIPNPYYQPIAPGVSGPLTGTNPYVGIPGFANEPKDQYAFNNGAYIYNPTTSSMPGNVLNFYYQYKF